MTPELLELGNRLHRLETDLGHHRFDCSQCFLGEPCDEQNSILDEMAKTRPAFWRAWFKETAAGADTVA